MTAYALGGDVSHIQYGPGTVTDVTPVRYGIGERVTVEFLTGDIETFVVAGDVQIPEYVFNEDLRKAMSRALAQRAATEALRAAETSDAPPFDMGSLAEILARPAQPPARIAGLIPWGASTTVVAARKTGKTTFLLCLARSLLTGAPFLDTFPVVPIAAGARVAFMNYEVTGETLARWADDMGVDRDRLQLVNLRGRRNPLGHPSDRAELAARLRALNIETLIVDPYSRATTQKKEDNNDTTAFLTDLDRFAREEAGATDLILAVHAGWNQERSRGASALEDWPDSIITLTRDTADDSTGERFMHAMGRDVDVDEDRLDFDRDTRLLRLAGAGSRKRSREDKKTADLAVYVVRAARAAPGLSYSAAELAIKNMDDAPRFRNGDVAKAARHAAERGHLHIGAGPRGAAALTPLDGAPNA